MNFLVIHTKYTDLEIGLYKNNQIIDLVTEANKTVSRDLFLIISKILNNHNLTLKNLSFIAAHSGPAPFTTLRVALASINGLAFTSNIPLIGVEGLTAFLQENKSKITTVAILNAFGQDLYYGICTLENNQINIGISKAQVLFENLKNKYTNHKIKFIGNGVNLYKQEILNSFRDLVQIPEPLPEIASINSIAQAALEKWEQSQTSAEIFPVYLKPAVAAS